MNSRSTYARLLATAASLALLAGFDSLLAGDDPVPSTPSDGPSAQSASPPSPASGTEHWAYRALATEDVPEVGFATWPNGPVDAFLLRQLEEQNLAPVADAEKHVLARRVFFLLHGLPPSPSALKAFVDDGRPDALPRLVDGLLSSPRFGERWGRHWLDLARYADSNGLDENFLFREAWRYRNWVIAAINGDMPLDQFVLEQIAGDLLPYTSVPERDRQRVAAGFLVIGPKVLLGNNPENQRMEVADEQLDTIGRVFLGQTLGCARCHDHKFDPIPTADYYAMAGILTSTEVMEKRYMLGQQRVMERLVGLGVGGDTADASYEAFWRERPQRLEKAKKAKQALGVLEKGVEDIAAFSKEYGDAVVAEAVDSKRTMKDRIAAQKKHVTLLSAALVAPKIPPRAMIPTDRPKPADERVRIAGKFDRQGETVPRGFLRAVSQESVDIPPEQSGRLQLAKWLIDAEGGAGRLTARVLVNRVWYHVFGRGLVRTVDNFGRKGEVPTHPRLLDYLAQHMLASDGSLKRFLCELLSSRAFALASDSSRDQEALDPDNRWLWRAHRRRLEPEVLRDAMLLVAEKLDLTPMDSTVWYLGDQATAVGKNENRRRTDFSCRSVYLPVIRNDLPEIFAAFDFADPHCTIGMRPRTTSPSQSLFFLNDAIVVEAAEGLARQLLQTGEKQNGARDNEEFQHRRVEELFERVLGEPSVDEERVEFLKFVREAGGHLAERGVVEAGLEAWVLACQALLASSRFQIIE